MNERTWDTREKRIHIGSLKANSLELDGSGVAYEIWISIIHSVNVESYLYMLDGIMPHADETGDKPESFTQDTPHHII